MIVVTGASGHIGGEIAARLSAAGEPTRLFVRDPARAPELTGAVPAVGDFRDPDSVAAAIDPGDRLFMVSVHEPNEERVHVHRRFIAAAREAGVAQIVYLSFSAASERAINYHARSHGTTERLLRESGVAWTFLRPTLYMEILPSRFDRQRVMRAPAGEGQANWISRSDIAAAAVAVLTGDGHAEHAYALTGPASLTLAETAAVVGTVLGEKFTYVDETKEAGWSWRRDLGQEDWAIEARLASWESVRAGEMDVLSDDFRLLTGTAATTLAENVAANAALYP